MEFNGRVFNLSTPLTQKIGTRIVTLVEHGATLELVKAKDPDTGKDVPGRVAVLLKHPKT